MHSETSFAPERNSLRAVIATAALLALSASTALYIRLGPIDAALLSGDNPASIEIVDRHGVRLYESLPASGERSLLLDVKHLSAPLVPATVAAEDHRFYDHAGVDPRSFIRAAWHDVKSRRFAEGGSTITQQVAKLLLGRTNPRARSLSHKIEEAVLAFRLEHRFGKNEILAMYLNLAPYGNQLIGAERASRGYFGCPSSSLTAAQAAYLASLPQRPTSRNPFRDAPRSRDRQADILRQMHKAGALSSEQLQSALRERLQLRPESRPTIAPHFVERVLASLPARNIGRIETTLDSALQSEIAGIIRSIRPSLERHGAHNVAVAVLDNDTGEWLAWEGSGNYEDAANGGAIDGVVTLRQPGSALKPFTYALAFERGFTPASVLPDIPSHFATAEQGVVYSPRNYDGQFRGPMLARAALAGSENVPAVAIASKVGVTELTRFLRAAGYTTFDKTASYYGLGITLGDAEVRLDQMVAAYAVFARGGRSVHPRFVRSMTTTAGERLHFAHDEDRQLVSPRTAFWITDILSDPDAREFIFGSGGSLDFPFPVAVKTGTSQAYHDNWTIGYTREVTVGVWVGNFDRTPLRSSSGVTGAGPIFHSVMLAALKQKLGRLPSPSDPPIVEMPTDLSRHRVCALSGLEATADCPNVRHEWLPDGPVRRCTWHYSADGQPAVEWPSEFQDWSSGNGSGGRSVSMPIRRISKQPSTLAITSPADGAIYRIDPTLRSEFQSLVLRAAAKAGSELRWTVDGRPLGVSVSGRKLTWPLRPGHHTFTVADSTRNAAVSATIFVK
ncbi:MAG TPA: penicillin-binding protein 1C [Thermoanaerobaculia bacterium]|nr:penicillin-binding protein 1C [Thermoanaerobaculia bacterium]